MALYEPARKLKAGDTDPRYTIRITLVADKRPKYWEMYCFHCKSKVTELSGDMMLVSDVADIQAHPDYAPAPQIHKCPGRWCDYRYEIIDLSA